MNLIDNCKLMVVVTAFACVIAPLAHGQDLPPGHPPTAPNELAAFTVPADVGSIDSIVTAYYRLISGPAGQKREWDRFRSLFLPTAQFITVRGGGEVVLPIVLSPEKFIEGNRNYFEKGGYFETEVNRRVDSFGTIAQVLSTYESRRSKDEVEPYAAGINSIQLIKTNDRWWIVSIIWDYERPEDNPIPEKYRGSGGSGGVGDEGLNDEEV